MTTSFRDPVQQPRGLLSVVAMLGAFGLFSGVVGCSFTVDANRLQCSQTSDCTNKGAAFADTVCKEGLCVGSVEDPKWSCGVPPVNSVPSYKLTMHLQDAVSSKPLAGIAAQLCRRLDVTCSEPSSAPVVSDSGGGVTMPIEAAFNGYVQLTDANAGSGATRISPSLYFLTAPTDGGDVNLPTVPLASPLAAAGIVYNATGTSWLDGRGIALLNAFDCQKQPAADISFSVGGTPDPTSFVFYLVNSLPTTDTTGTDATGYGGLANAAPGVSTITATLGSSGRKVSTISVLIRAGYISYSSVTPNSSM